MITIKQRFQILPGHSWEGKSHSSSLCSTSSWLRRGPGGKPSSRQGRQTSLVGSSSSTGPIRNGVQVRAHRTLTLGQNNRTARRKYLMPLLNLEMTTSWSLSPVSRVIFALRNFVFNPRYQLAAKMFTISLRSPD